MKQISPRQHSLIDERFEPVIKITAKIDRHHRDADEFHGECEHREGLPLHRIKNNASRHELR